jgi:o-succinylbenzoate synthase
MIKFWTSKYELVPWQVFGAVADASPRQGALLKAEWSNGNVGYADIFPWPEFGDADIVDQIRALGMGKISPLVEQAIWLAKKDAGWRKEKKNAHIGATKVKNHFLVTDFTKFNEAAVREARTAGFTTFKFKVGRAVDEEGKFITKFLKQNPVLVRLDFNAKTDFQEFERLFSHLGTAEKARVEFVEDPVTWAIDAWAEAAKIIPLALDMENEKIDFDKFTSKPPFGILIVKPARIDMDKALKFVSRWGLKMVVSSSLDHPVGVAQALAQAAELKKFYPNAMLDCGCLTLKAYKPNEFMNHIQTTGPFLKEIKGTGIGFDELWDKQEWTPVGR